MCHLPPATSCCHLHARQAHLLLNISLSVLLSVYLKFNTDCNIKIPSHWQNIVRRIMPPRCMPRISSSSQLANKLHNKLPHSVQQMQPHKSMQWNISNATTNVAQQRQSKLMKEFVDKRPQKLLELLFSSQILSSSRTTNSFWSVSIIKLWLSELVNGTKIFIFPIPSYRSWHSFCCCFEILESGF